MVTHSRTAPATIWLPAGNDSPECGAVVAAFGGTVCMEPPQIQQDSPLPGQVQGLTWQGETEPGARAEWQGGMWMQTRARADCPRALRIASALRLRHGENQHHYASSAQNALERACPSFWHKYPDSTQKRVQRIRTGQKRAILQRFTSQTTEKPAPLHQARWAGCSSGGWWVH